MELSLSDAVLGATSVEPDFAELLVDVVNFLRPDPKRGSVRTVQERRDAPESIGYVLHQNNDVDKVGRGGR